LFSFDHFYLTGLCEASSLHRDILRTDFSLLRSSLKSYRDEIKCKTQSEMFPF
jgi:hypothetical protein